MLFRSRDQTCAVVGDNVLRFVWTGILDGADVSDLFERVRRDGPEWPRVSLIWNMERAQLIPRAARRELLDQMIRLPIVATAVVTNDMAIRIPITMLLEVVMVDSKSRPAYRFFDDEAKAATWIEAACEDTKTRST